MQKPTGVQMWYLNNIPKQLFLYWGKNKPLNWLRFNTVRSFARHNPDWDIIVYYPEYSINKLTWHTPEQKHDNDIVERDWFKNLSYFAEVKPFDFKCTIVENASEVHRSDFIRLYLLSEYGGWWSDFDILYIKPMSELKLESHDYYFCWNDKEKYNIGNFIGGVKETTDNVCLFKSLTMEMEGRFNNADYQSLGRTLYDSYICFNNNKYTGILEADVGALPFESVNPVSWDKLNELFETDVLLNDNTIGIHWFGGGEHTTIKSGSTIHKYISEYT